MSTAQAELAQFESDSEYYEKHRESLLILYPEQWIAIFEHTVVGAAPAFEDLLNMLRERGVPPERSLVKHITRREDLLILST